MKSSPFVAAAILVAGVVSIASPANNPQTRVPVLLELFTSEGCSSCPSADRLLEKLQGKQPSANADLIVLSEHVDYWNRLGWKDPFSAAAYSVRQQDYSAKLHTDDVYTPQLVVDGRFAFVGSDERQALAAIEKAIRGPKIEIKISHLEKNGSEVTAHIEVTAELAAKNEKATLYCAIADDRVESQVTRGENSGRLLAHVGVTRVLQDVAKIDTRGGFVKAIRLPFSPAATGSRMIVFLQDSKSGRVLGVAAQQI